MATLTLGLQNLRRQVDAVFPGRDKASDGWIGNEAHQLTTSGHNPDDTPGSTPAWDRDADSLAEVRAWDMDNDLGIDAQVLVDHIRRLPGLGGVIRYMIYNRRLYHERNGYQPVLYDGPSPHTEHVHFEGAWLQAADNDATFDYHLQEIPVALTDADKTWLKTTIASAVDARVGDVVQRWDGDGNPLPPTDPNPKMTAASALGYLGRDAGIVKETLERIEAAVTVTPPPAS
jgi:hypothetical protein